MKHTRRWNKVLRTKKIPDSPSGWISCINRINFEKHWFKTHGWVLFLAGSADDVFQLVFYCVTLVKDGKVTIWKVWCFVPQVRNQVGSRIQSHVVYQWTCINICFQRSPFFASFCKDYCGQNIKGKYIHCPQDVFPPLVVRIFVWEDEAASGEETSLSWNGV